NLADNVFLDDTDGGFTVFGEVLENGMDVVDAMAEVRRFTHSVDGFNFSDWPLRNYTRADRNAGVPVNQEQLVLIHAISVLYGVDEEEPPAQDDEPTEPSPPEPDEENQNSEEVTEEPTSEPVEEDHSEEPEPADEADEPAEPPQPPA